MNIIIQASSLTAHKVNPCSRNMNRLEINTYLSRNRNLRRGYKNYDLRILVRIQIYAVKYIKTYESTSVI